MCPAIDNPASYEICTVNHFLRTKNMTVAEILHELCAVYCQNVMREGSVRQWCRMFEDGQTDVQNEEQSGQPAICCK
jgi:hypothetical protein